MVRIDSNVLFKIIEKWTWQELLFGVQNNFIGNKDIIEYAKKVLTEEVSQFEYVLSMAIAEEDEVCTLLALLVKNETKECIETIRNKWIFVYVYYSNIYYSEQLNEIIDGLYAEFNYPDCLRGLVTYMPSDNFLSLDEKIKVFIENGKSVWAK